MRNGPQRRQREDSRHDQDLRNPRQEDLQEGAAGAAGGRRGELVLAGASNVLLLNTLVPEAETLSTFVSAEQLHRLTEEEQHQTQTSVSYAKEEVKDNRRGEAQISESRRSNSDVKTKAFRGKSAERLCFDFRSITDVQY